MDEQDLLGMQGMPIQTPMMEGQPQAMPLEPQSFYEHQPEIVLEDELQQEESNFHANIIDDLDADEVAEIQRHIWKSLKPHLASNASVKDNFAKVMKLLGDALPIGSDSYSTSNSTSDSYIKNSGSSKVMASPIMDCWINIRESILHILFGGEGKMDARIAPELQGNPEVEMRAKRQARFSTAFFGRGLCSDFKNTLSQAIDYAVLTGDCYRKTFDDPRRGWPRSANLLPGDYFYMDDILNSQGEAAFVHLYSLSKEEMNEKIDKGEWSQSLTSLEGYETDQDALKNRDLKASGRDEIEDENSQNKLVVGDLYGEFEIKSDPALPDNPRFNYLPYRIVFGNNGYITAIHRNWGETDALCLPLNDFTRYKFIGGLSKYSLGLMHIGGQRSRAATVLQRQLIDSAQLANTPTGFVRPTGRMTEKSFDLEAGKFAELAPSDSDVNKAISYLPFNAPSPITMQLIQKFEGEIRSLSHMVSDQLLSIATQAPSSTLVPILNRMEQLPNAILQNMYDSFCQELRIYKRKIYDWLTPGQMFTFEWQGEIYEIEKDDFAPGIDIMPCGSFTVESSAYRMVRGQMILQQAQAIPQFHNLPNILKNVYKDAGLTDEQVKLIIVDPSQTPPPPPVPSREPVAENTAMLTGQPVQAYTGQDHKAHRQVHSLLFQHPDPNVQAAAMAHDKHHEALEMMEQLQAMSGVQLPPDTEQLPMEQQNAIAVEMAKASLQLEQMRTQQQGQQQPIDPGLVKLEEIQASREKNQMENEISLKRIEVDKEMDDTKHQVELLNMQIQTQKLNHETLMKEMEMKMQSQREDFNLLMQAKKSQTDEHEKIMKGIREEIEFLHKHQHDNAKLEHEKEKSWLDRLMKGSSKKEKTEEE